MSTSISKSLKSTAIILLISAASIFPALLPYPSSMPKVTTPYDTILLKTWEGIKARNIDPYTTGLVHRPKSNMPHDAVSEGVAYGMILALYCNDQAYFNKIWNAGEKHMWVGDAWDGGNYYDWRVNRNGEKVGQGPASDADQDIALLLIFADELVKNGIWKAYASEATKATYSVRAKALLNTIRTKMVVDGRFLLPGGWGEEPDVKNPGYFAPAFYRIFAEYDSENKAAWEALVNGSYELIAKSPGYALGLIPDWCTLEGESTGGAGYNAYFDGDALYRDAIRVYWRLGTDYLWYKEPRAKAFLDKAIAFLESKGTPAPLYANFFDISGNLLPDDDAEQLGGDGSDIIRTRREHSHLTVGLWAAAAMASGGAVLAEGYSVELLTFYKPGTNYWGHAVDPSGGTEDTLHNEMYFDQFLAWFGASILGGAFTNVWEDLKDGVPTGPPEWRTRPRLSTYDVNASVAPLRVSGAFTRSVRFTATFTHDSTGKTATFSASSDTIDLLWYGLSESGAFMPQGFYTLTIDAPGLAFPHVETGLWLGKSYDLMRGNRLLVDDFADGDVYPYIGTVWASFLDSHPGADGTSSAAISVDKESDGVNWLRWKYTLGRDLGFDPYAGLDWSCRASDGSPMNLTGIDTLIVVAKVPSGRLDNVSVQLVSADFNFPGEYQYFSDSSTMNLTTTRKEFAMPIAKFAQRRDGNGKSLATTLTTMTAIRFQVQDASGSTGTIMIESMYFAGDVSRLYKAPPEYLEPTGPIGPPEVIKVKHGLLAGAKYSVKRGVGMIRIAMSDKMAGAGVMVVDVRGRVVGRMVVGRDGRLNVSTRGLAKGLYFIDIRKQGVGNLKVKVLNSK